MGSSFVAHKVYFIEPENEVDITIKKDMSEPTNVSYSFISVRGLELGFNISLKVCESDLCQSERDYYQVLSSMPTLYNPDSNVELLSIFVGIGVTLAVLALLCLFCILAAKRRKKEQEIT